MAGTAGLYGGRACSGNGDGFGRMGCGWPVWLWGIPICVCCLCGCTSVMALNVCLTPFGSLLWSTDNENDEERGCGETGESPHG